MFSLVHVAPKDVFLGQASLGVLRQVIASERDAPVLVRCLAQEDAEHGLKGVLGTELVDLIELLHEALQVSFGARGCEADDAGEPVVLDSRGLVCLQYLHALDARCAVTLFEAHQRFIQEPVDIARAVSVFDAAHQGLVQFQLHFFQLLRCLSLFNIILFIGVAVLRALRREYVNDGRPSIKLHSDLLRRGPEVNLPSVLLIINILQRHVSNRVPLCLVLSCW